MGVMDNKIYTGVVDAYYHQLECGFLSSPDFPKQLYFERKWCTGAIHGGDEVEFQIYQSDNDGDHVRMVRVTKPFQQ